MDGVRKLTPGELRSLLRDRFSYEDEDLEGFGQDELVALVWRWLSPLKNSPGIPTNASSVRVHEIGPLSGQRGLFALRDIEANELIHTEASFPAVRWHCAQPAT